MTASSQTRPAITLPDYERIFRTIHGVLLNEDGDPSRACLYFGVIGAAILQKHHRLRAEPVVGTAAYRLDGNVLVFAGQDESGISATENGFHCWVEVNGMVIDFQAPLFKEMLAQRKPGLVIPRKMMQKRLDQANASLESLAVSGSHWHEPNHSLRSALLAEFIEKPANIDLAEICSQWYRPTPKKMLPHIQIGDQHGRARRVALSPLRISGAW